MKPNISIDFDGVIHDDSHPIEGRSMGPPVPGAKESLDQLSKNFRIIVFSVRGGSPKHVEDWMDYYEVPYDEVTNVKVKSDFYIDDHAIRFRNWDETMSDIGRLQ